MAEKILLTGRSRRAVERMLGAERIHISMDESADDVTRKITRAYGKAWSVVSRTMREMSKFAAEQHHNGVGLSAHDIARMDRVDRAMHAMERQIRVLGTYTGVQVTGAASRQVEHALDRVLGSLSTLTGLDRRFTTPSANAMEGLILRSTGRIEAASQRLTAAQASKMKDSLFRGLILGENPRSTAKHIMDATEQTFFGGLSRAETIARTEIGDAHRYATRLAYGESDLVVGWKWLASLSGRTCPACWQRHGSFHEKTEMMFSHQNCRCTMMPVLMDDDPADHDLGNPERLFWQLPRETQLSVMGPGRLKALEAGAPWDELSYVGQNPGWRPSVKVTPVADLTGLAELNLATFPGDVITIPGYRNAGILSEAFVKGGLTVHAGTGEIPTSGVAVAEPDKSLVIDAREFFGPAGPNALSSYLTKYGDVLDQDDVHLGMWHDTARGVIVLDVVHVIADREEAIALGRQWDQIAVFDLGTFEEISTGGSGGYLAIETPLKAGQTADPGKVVQWRDGDFTFTGTVEKTNASGSVRVIKEDGESVVIWPDQILTVGTSDDVKAKAARLAEIAEAGKKVHGVSVNYAGLTVDVAEQADKALREVREAWPEVSPISVGVKETQAFALTGTNFSLFGFPEEAKSEVFIDDDYGADPALWKKDMKGAEDTGHFHGGTTDEFVDYSMEHEFGHVLDFRLFGDPREADGHTKRLEIIAEVTNAVIGKFDLPFKPLPTGVTGPTTSKADTIRDFFNTGLLDRWLTKDLSGYAITSPQELFAEAFAVYRDHGPGESVAADTIMRAFVKAYEDQFGKRPEERDLDVLFDEEGDGTTQLALFGSEGS